MPHTHISKRKWQWITFQLTVAWILNIYAFSTNENSALSLYTKKNNLKKNNITNTLNCRKMAYRAIKSLSQVEKPKFTMETINN